jgi:hypothetical protein
LKVCHTDGADILFYAYAQKALKVCHTDGADSLFYAYAFYIIATFSGFFGIVTVVRPKKSKNVQDKNWQYLVFP